MYRLKMAESEVSWSNSVGSWYRAVIILLMHEKKELFSTKETSSKYWILCVIFLQIVFSLFLRIFQNRAIWIWMEFWKTVNKRRMHSRALYIRNTWQKNSREVRKAMKQWQSRWQELYRRNNNRTKTPIHSSQQNNKGIYLTSNTKTPFFFLNTIQKIQ